MAFFEHGGNRDKLAKARTLLNPYRRHSQSQRWFWRIVTF
jgi:hypothetical protein